MKEVLLTNKLDKSEVQHQGLYDDVVKATVIFDAVVVLLCRRCLRGGHGGSLVDRSLQGMCFPFAAAVTLPTFTSQNVRLKGDLVAGLRHVALFSLCSPVRLSIGGFLRRFSSFAATVTERGTKELRSQHCATQQGQVSVRAGGTRDKGTKATVGKTGSPHQCP